MSSPTKPTFSPEFLAINLYPLSRGTGLSSEELLLCRATECFSPLKPSEPFVQRAPDTQDAALVRKLSIALESMSIDLPNVEEPRVKKVTWADDHATKARKLKHHLRIRGVHSTTHSTPAETKSDWRSGSRDPQFKATSSPNWRSMTSAKNMGSRSRGNSVSTFIPAERKMKRKPMKSLNPS